MENKSIKSRFTSILQHCLSSTCTSIAACTYNFKFWRRNNFETGIQHYLLSRTALYVQCPVCSLTVDSSNLLFASNFRLSPIRTVLYVVVDQKMFNSNNNFLRNRHDINMSMTISDQATTSTSILSPNHTTLPFTCWPFPSFIHDDVV